MNRIRRVCLAAFTIVLLANSAKPEISQQTRTSIDHVIGHNGSYVPEEGVYTAIQLTKAVRYALDVQVGTVSPGSGEKI